MQNLLNSPTNPSELRKIRYKIHPHSLHTFSFLTISREFQEIGANLPDFMHFTHSSHELHEIRTHGQQSRSESSELQENTENYTNSAPFAPTAGKLHKIRDICTQTGKLHTFLHIFMHIVIAHICTHSAPS